MLSVEPLKTICQAISSETGRQFDIADIDVPFADLCLDPLAIMNVLEVVKDHTGVELPASVFRDSANLSQVVKKLSESTNGKSLSYLPSYGFFLSNPALEQYRISKILTAYVTCGRGSARRLVELAPRSAGAHGILS